MHSSAGSIGRLYDSDAPQGDLSITIDLKDNNTLSDSGLVDGSGQLLHPDLSDAISRTNGCRTTTRVCRPIEEVRILLIHQIIGIY